MADDNPFDTESNPFADPAAGASEDHLPAMYDPFGGGGSSYGTSDADAAGGGGGGGGGESSKKKKKKKKKDYGDESAWPTEQQEALLQTGAAASITAVAAGAAANFGAAAGSVREQNLLRREQALMQKEVELQERERRLASLLKEKNWPFSCWAIAYHSIEDEIPVEDRPLISRFYLLIRLTWLCLFVNWLCSFAVKFGADGDTSDLLWSSVYLLLGTPGAWFLWYRPIYSATRDDSSKTWGFFFINFFVHTGFAIVMACGIPGTAGMGLWTFMDTIDDHKTPGIFALVSSILWILCGLMSFAMMRRAHNLWRGRGGEEAAKKALAKEAAKRQAANMV